MISHFADMAADILDLLGEDAFFDGGTEPIKINIEHGVQLTGIGGEEASYRGDLVVNRDVATIHHMHNPTVGKRFIQNGLTYRLETLLEDNGATRRYVISRSV